MHEPFPDRSPCFTFLRPDPSYRGARVQNQTLTHLAGERWSWWCFESFDRPKSPKTICLHVMRGHEERELRWDVPVAEYRAKVVRVLVRLPRHVYELIIDDRMETWPELARIVEAMTADMREQMFPEIVQSEARKP